MIMIMILWLILICLLLLLLLLLLFCHEGSQGFHPDFLGFIGFQNRLQQFFIQYIFIFNVILIVVLHLHIFIGQIPQHTMHEIKSLTGINSTMRFGTIKNDLIGGQGSFAKILSQHLKGHETGTILRKHKFHGNAGL